MKRKNHKSGRGRSKFTRRGGSGPSTSEPTTLVRLASSIDKLNARDKQISARLGVIGAESSKLHAELQGNAVRRGKLQREFDAASEL